MNKTSSVDKSYLLLVGITLSILLYFSFTVVPRGDEGEPYLIALNEAYSVWPWLDTSPAWSLSSLYLWLVTTFHSFFLVMGKVDILTSGRILSLVCWTTLASLILYERKGVRWKATMVLFNPYLLIYVTRVHPLMPALLLIYLFWKGIQRGSRFWGVWLLFAVTFQVFTGGVAAMLLPKTLEKNFVKGFQKAVSGFFFAVGGVLLTWGTWGGGMYPEAFRMHDFFKIHHENGTLSFGYLSLVFMITGGVMWIIGDRSLKMSFSSLRKVLYVLIIMTSLASALYFGKPTVGVIETLLYRILPDEVVGVIHVLVFAFLGIGWLRVERDLLLLFLGVLGTGILTTVLPYQYERIAVFATLPPLLIWVLMGWNSDEKASVKWMVIFCFIFLFLSCIYQLFGAL